MSDYESANEDNGEKEGGGEEKEGEEEEGEEEEEEVCFKLIELKAMASLVRLTVVR